MKSIRIISLALLLSVFCFSCKKEIDPKEIKTSDSVISHKSSVYANREGCSDTKCEITSWLLDQQKTVTERGVKVIDELIAKLAFESMTTEDLNEGEIMYIVPIDSTFRTENNKYKIHMDRLLIVVDKDNNIRKGNIVQFVNNENTWSDVPEGLFHNFYNADVVNWDGTITFLTVTDMFIEDYYYTEGKMRVNRLATAKNAVGPTCTEWWLVVTTFNWDDGSTTVNETYMFTTCIGGGGDCGPMTTTQPGCDIPTTGGGNGSTSNPNPDPIPVYKNKRWTVATNSYWQVFSVEKFYGAKYPGQPSLNHFTEVTHGTDWLDQNSLETFYWFNNHANVSHSPTTAISTVFGEIKNTEIPDIWIFVYQNNSMHFTFNQVF